MAQRKTLLQFTTSGGSVKAIPKKIVVEISRVPNDVPVWKDGARTHILCTHDVGYLARESLDELVERFEN